MAQTPLIIRKGIDPLPQEAVRTIAELIRTVRYGSITLVVQEGRVAQIDKTEKFRLNNSK